MSYFSQQVVILQKDLQIMDHNRSMLLVLRLLQSSALGGGASRAQVPPGMRIINVRNGL
jgi:hypothetical protein